MDYGKRMKQFQKSMNCDCAVLVSEGSDSNVFYLTGFRGASISFLAVFRNRVLFITSKLDIQNMQNKAVKKVLFEKTVQDTLKKYIPKRKIIGIDSQSLKVAAYNTIKKAAKPRKVTDVSKILLEQRKIKSKEEINLIENAARETCSILDEAMQNMACFSTESEIKNFIDTEIKRRGHENAFDTIAASGKNASNPHYSSCSGKLKRGFMIIDCGLKVKGYCSDLTRTCFLGIPTQKELDEYKEVLDLQNQAVDMLKTKSFGEADEFARRRLGKKCAHSLGHGIGIDVHENPRMNKLNREKINEGMCFAVEPGSYWKSAGIRIEDDFAVISGKIKRLTPLTNNLRVINNKLYK